MSDKHPIIFGIHAVKAALQSRADQVIRISIQKSRQDKKIDELVRLAKEENITIEVVTRETLDKMSRDENHQGIIAYCKPAKTHSSQDLKTLVNNISGTPLILVLDGVQDPHNLGACFRTADAAGVHIIVAPKDKSASITPVVQKVACGATESVPFVQVTNLARALVELKELGIWIYGAAEEAESSLYQTDLKGPAAIVMGAEGEGLRRLTKEHCDVLVNIPMLGAVSSLNVSVATGVLLFEVVRQRNGGSSLDN